jgi:hypothetical protein
MDIETKRRAIQERPPTEMPADRLRPLDTSMNSTKALCDTASLVEMVRRR